MNPAEGMSLRKKSDSFKWKLSQKRNQKETLKSLNLNPTWKVPQMVHMEGPTDGSTPRRTSTRETCKADCHGVRVCTATELQKEPQTVKEALSCPEKEHWEVAMQKEMDSIHSNDVWDLVELPGNRKLVVSK